MKVLMTEVTDDNRGCLIRLTMSMRIGEKCKYCLHEYKTLDDLYNREVVYAGNHKHGLLACKSCWDENN